MAGTVSSVLFVCNFNTVRSPMAAVLARHYFGPRVFVGSAGVRLGEPDGFAAAAMAEIGLDIARHVPERLDDLEDMGFDLIVTLTPEAHHRALELTRHHPLEVEYWPTEDPTAAMGSREQRLAAYRLVRDALEERILQRFAAPVPAGG